MSSKIVSNESQNERFFLGMNMNKTIKLGNFVIFLLLCLQMISGITDDYFQIFNFGSLMLMFPLCIFLTLSQTKILVIVFNCIIILSLVLFILGSRNKNLILLKQYRIVIVLYLFLISISLVDYFVMIQLLLRNSYAIGEGYLSLGTLKALFIIIIAFVSLVLCFVLWMYYCRAVIRFVRKVDDESKDIKNTRNLEDNSTTNDK